METYLQIELHMSGDGGVAEEGLKARKVSAQSKADCEAICRRAG
jgi:hypothetical protein